MGVIVGEHKMVWVHSENIAWFLGIESLHVLKGFAEESLIFSEGYFAIHPLDNFLIIDLLLDGQFGQFIQLFALLPWFLRFA